MRWTPYVLPTLCIFLLVPPNSQFKGCQTKQSWFHSPKIAHVCKVFTIFPKLVCKLFFYFQSFPQNSLKYFFTKIKFSSCFLMHCIFFFIFPKKSILKKLDPSVLFLFFPILWFSFINQHPKTDLTLITGKHLAQSNPKIRSCVEMYQNFEIKICFLKNLENFVF